MPIIVFMRPRSSGQSIVLLLALVAGCSRDATRPLSASDALAASDSMRKAIQPAHGFRSGGHPCSSASLCFVGAGVATQSVGSYKQLIGRFGVELSKASCDAPLESATTGRAIQQCFATGRFGRWIIASTLTVTRDVDGQDQTLVTLDPVREVG
jgi:hypothetical protein